ncbi:M24 family metallopeptidase [Adhaeretor mobilis]|uniref:Putative peptidase n=1 Tax=Adhaeretor mobilis TaxID=1930276 RepID=A0A517MYH2_9BACT|nr:Xaa-Pro peptidase family protein [Adhaeretor mobilis]QDS99867.1 putative peptidase [Adhaeretor mobilis]
MNHAPRRSKIRRQLKKEGLDALLVTNFVNVTYLTGFTGDDSYLLVTTDRDILISDQRYSQQLESECPDVDLQIRGPGQKMIDDVAKTLKKCKVSKLGIEASSMTVALRDKVERAVPKARLEPTDGWIEALRMIKDRDEIAATRRACELARRAFEVVRAKITGETKESEIAADLEYQARRFGGKGLSFTPIVGVQERAALPHGTATERKIGSGDFVLIDWGVNESLYMSDLTRILATGKISTKLRKLYGVVLKAQLAGIAAIKPGVTCEKVDAAARKVIERAGHGKYFGHGLGHGTGLEIHEAPRLAKNQETKLEAGMIVTVEPGIYFPEWGGIRIEDDILVTRSGHEVLSNVPKELDECIVG